MVANYVLKNKEDLLLSLVSSVMHGIAAQDVQVDHQRPMIRYFSSMLKSLR